MKLIIWALLIILLIAAAQAQPQLNYKDKIRIREAVRINELLGKEVWKGIEQTPFPIILVTDSIEFLIHHPHPSSDFKSLGKDSILQTEIYYRPRVFNPHFLATFPAIDNLSCVVIGTPENTGLTSSKWIHTLLHEHFHQYQYSWPEYQTDVNNLSLSDGDKTGMWMLNYAFPYTDSIINKRYEAYKLALTNAVNEIGKITFKRKLKQYYIERNNLKKVLKPADYAYFSFQIWQEGLARYTEYWFLKAMAENNYIPTNEFTELSDFKNFKDVFYKMRKGELNKLKRNLLSDKKRECFYAVGFAEGLLLDAINSRWHNRYRKEKFYIEKYKS